MSINGIRGGHDTPTPRPSLRDRASVDEAAGKAIRTPEHGTDDVNAARRFTQSVPVEAPPGTDPALWSVLTSNERSYLASARPAGPLTYSPTKSGPVSAGGLLGGLIDLRV